MNINIKEPDDDILAKATELGFNSKKCSFSYSICEMIDSAVKKPISVDDKVAARLKNTFASLVIAQKGKNTKSIKLSVLPAVIEEQYRETALEQAKTKAEFDAKTPEERNTEIENLLSQLRGPGFMEIRIGRK